MLKNRIIPAFVLAGLVGVAACERQEETRIETVPPTTETPATTPGTTVEPMPGTMHDDTLHYTDPNLQPGTPGAAGTPGAPGMTTPQDTL
jgi:hypothetical protein